MSQNWWGINVLLMSQNQLGSIMAKVCLHLQILLFNGGYTNNFENNINGNFFTNSINTNYKDIYTEAASALLQLSSVSSAISAEGSKTWNKRNSSSMEGVKEIRLNSSQLQQQRVNDQKKQNYKIAFKEAFLLYKMERERLSQRRRKVPRLFAMKLVKNIKQHWVQGWFNVIIKKNWRKISE